MTLFFSIVSCIGFGWKKIGVFQQIILVLWDLSLWYVNVNACIEEPRFPFFFFWYWMCMDCDGLERERLDFMLKRWLCISFADWKGVSRSFHGTSTRSLCWVLSRKKVNFF